MSAPLTLSPQEARRLAVAAQRLERPRPNPTRADVLETIRRITCVQIDPINVVARTQLLVLFSRLGVYDPADLNRLLWDERALFEYWAHAASIVLADDFPLFQPQIERRRTTKGNPQAEAWLAANAGFRQYILDEIAARGPLFTHEIEDRALVGLGPSVWYGGRAVGPMLEMMWLRGDVTVTQRAGSDYGLKKQWGLLEHQLPGHKDRPPLPRHQAVKAAAERALMALGPARRRDVKSYFIRHSYPGLEKVLAELEAEGRIVPVAVRGEDGEWPGPWYVHVENLPLLERVHGGEWRPQTVLLSPFDNLIADRDRTELLFDFLYRIEIYTPAAKRRYGYYNMPILHGDRIIGRVDPRMDRKANRLVVNAVHLEPGVSLDGETRAAVGGAVESLARFLGAGAIDYVGASG